MDLYRVLGVAPSASSEQIADAYRAKATRFHPDNGGDPYGWKSYQSAYDTLIVRG